MGELTSRCTFCLSIRRTPLRQDRCSRGSQQEGACGQTPSDHPESLQEGLSRCCSRGSPCNWACRRPWWGNGERCEWKEWKNVRLEVGVSDNWLLRTFPYAKDEKTFCLCHPKTSVP